MDYKEKYEALVGGIKGWLDKYVGDWQRGVFNLPFDKTGEIAKDIIKLVPELAESEDERLEKARETLIKALKREIDEHCEGYAYFGITVKDIVAILEKQKEQKPIPALDRGDEIILKAICEELKDAPGWVERIGGWYSLAKDAQQPAERSEGDERIRKNICRIVKEHMRHCAEAGIETGDHREALQYLEKQKERKPVENTPIYVDAAKKYFDSWIEKHSDSPTKWGCFWEGLLYSGKLQQTAEEKEYVRTIKSLVADAIRLAECNEVKGEVHGEIIAQSGPDIAFYQRLIDWVEGRHVYQSAEWSEGDEKNWGQIFACIKDDALKEWLEKQKERIVADIKTLRPQPQWMPSEEQMDALMNMRFAVEKFGPSASLAALNSLYNDLKNL